MSLALRLLNYFALVALLATATVGLGAREAWRHAEERRFDEQLEAAKAGVLRELAWEASQIRDLLQSKCEHDAYIDQALTKYGSPDFEDRRLGIAQLVPQEMKALHLDELLLFMGTGEILGAGPDPAVAGKAARPPAPHPPPPPPH